jgi:hypothetical protein
METPPSGKPEGYRTRAWWGVKMVSFQGGTKLTAVEPAPARVYGQAR